MAANSSLKRSRTPSPSLEDGQVSKRSRQAVPSELPRASIPVRFLVLSDTHGRHNGILKSMPPCDVLLHCGDFTEDGSTEAIRQAVKAFSQVDAELKLFIAGNHEIALDKDYYLSQGGTQKAHLEAISLVSTSGIQFLEEGTHHFTLKSGAHFKIFVSPYTPLYGSSAFQYPTSEDRFNPANITPSWANNVGTEKSIIPKGVDVVMTHGPPKYILDRTAEGNSGGCEHLRRAIARVRPRLHCFGHIHNGYGAQRVYHKDKKLGEEGEDHMVLLPQEWVGKNQAKKKGYAGLAPGSAEKFKKEEKESLMVNAAIMDDDDEPVNTPWLVELDLPSS